MVTESKRKEENMTKRTLTVIETEIRSVELEMAPYLADVDSDTFANVLVMVSPVSLIDKTKYGFIALGNCNSKRSECYTLLANLIVRYMLLTYEHLES